MSGVPYFGKIRPDVMCPAALARGESEAARGIEPPDGRPTEVDDCRHILFERQRSRAVADGFSDLMIQQGRGQLNGVTWQDPCVETVEPARVYVMPRPILDDHMVVNTVTLRRLKRT